MKEKFRQEEDKNRAVSYALDKIIYDETDFSNIIKEL